MTRVIAVSREYGSGGGEIASRVAAALGWTLVDRAILEDVARMARVAPQDAHAADEQVDAWLHRVAKAFWMGSPEAGTGTAAQEILDADRMAALTRRAILDRADAGSCVVLGRGAQCVLGDRADVLRVFVYAPVGERIRRLRDRHASDDEALAAIERVDRARTAWLRRYFGCAWGDRGCFDLMVNASLGTERAVSVILAAADRVEGRAR